MAFTRWVRNVSEKQLMTAAQTKIAGKYGLASSPPKGGDVFWQKVYAPVFHALPVRLRSRVAARMPGSHRRTWHQPAQVAGPAAALLASGAADRAHEAGEGTVSGTPHA